MIRNQAVYKYVKAHQVNLENFFYKEFVIKKFRTDEIALDFSISDILKTILLSHAAPRN